MSSISLHLPNLAATETVGRRLGERLFPGAVLALIGQLGAGKTHLTRAIAEGLQVRNPAAVNSPTFVLIKNTPPAYRSTTSMLIDSAAIASSSS